MASPGNKAQIGIPGVQRVRRAVAEERAEASEGYCLTQHLDPVSYSTHHCFHAQVVLKLLKGGKSTLKL
jgi:hypothetical protein